MANDDFLSASGADDAADPDNQARITADFDRVIAEFPDSYWRLLQTLLATAAALYQQLWLQPAVNSLAPAIEQLTAINEPYCQLMLAVTEPRDYVLETTRPGTPFYFYVLVARHLLDTPVGDFILQHMQDLARSAGRAPTPPEEQRRQLAAGFDLWQKHLSWHAATIHADRDIFLLEAQLASLMREACQQPALFLNTIATRPLASWPAPAAADAPTAGYVLPGDYAFLLQLGISYLIIGCFKLTSAWAAHLLTQVPHALLLRLRPMLEALRKQPRNEEIFLRLDLPASAELHLVAHLSGVLVSTGVLDELQDLVTASSSTPWGGDGDDDASLAALLPPGVVLPAAGLAGEQEEYSLPGNLGLLASIITKELEELFGYDAPALVANREVAARLVAFL